MLLTIDKNFARTARYPVIVSLCLHKVLAGESQKCISYIGNFTNSWVTKGLLSGFNILTWEGGWVAFSFTRCHSVASENIVVL